VIPHQVVCGERVRRWRLVMPVACDPADEAPAPAAVAGDRTEDDEDDWYRWERARFRGDRGDATTHCDHLCWLQTGFAAPWRSDPPLDSDDGRRVTSSDSRRRRAARRRYGGDGRRSAPQTRRDRWPGAAELIGQEGQVVPPGDPAPPPQ
jgi:hypothetical protein